MEDTPKPTNWSKIKRPEKVVKLPEPGPEGDIYIKIAKLHPSSILKNMQGLPSFPVEPEIKDESDKKVNAVEIARIVTTLDSVNDLWAALCIEACIEPKFSTSHQDGLACWSDLTARNRAALVEEILLFAGMRAEQKETGKEAEAASLAGFSSDAGRPEASAAALPDR